MNCPLVKRHIMMMISGKEMMSMYGVKKEEESDSDISVMSSELILMNNELDYEEKEAVALMIDESKENKDGDDLDFQALINLIICSELNKKQQTHQLVDNSKLLIENLEISCRKCRNQL